MTTDQSDEMEAHRTHGGAMSTNLLLLSVEEAADVLRLGRTRTYEFGDDEEDPERQGGTASARGGQQPG